MDEHENIMSLQAFLKESNAIENIHNRIIVKDVEVVIKFLNYSDLCVHDVQKLALDICSLDTTRGVVPLLRSKSSMPSVIIGGYRPIPSGPEVIRVLGEILKTMNEGGYPSVMKCHISYEKLHPLMDGNGRSGRVLALWYARKYFPMEYKMIFKYGWLRSWYYWTLSESR